MANSYGTATALSGNANSLSAGGYTSLGVINFGSAPPSECFVEVSLQVGSSPSGNMQAVVYVRSSLDGTNFSTAPGSSDYRNAVRIGELSLPDTTARRSVAMPVSPAFGGALPPKVEVYVFNDAGVPLNASGQVGQYQTETFG